MTSAETLKNWMHRGCRFLSLALLLSVSAQSQTRVASSRTVSGVVTTNANELVPGAAVVAEVASGKKQTEARVHGTPGFPIGFTLGLTFRLGEKWTAGRCPSKDTSTADLADGAGLSIDPSPTVETPGYCVAAGRA